jgi:hypothetical protein
MVLRGSKHVPHGQCRAALQIVPLELGPYGKHITLDFCWVPAVLLPA